MIDPPYTVSDEEDRYETYYWEPTRNPLIEQYELMLEQDWLNEPLRDLLETRVETLQ